MWIGLALNVRHICADVKIRRNPVRSDNGWTSPNGWARGLRYLSPNGFWKTAFFSDSLGCSPMNTCASSYEKHSSIDPAKRTQCSPNLNPEPAPSVCAEERRARRIRARACLSAASLHETPAGLSTAGCPQRSGGTRTVGSPFFSLGFFGEAKKSKSPAAAIERRRNSSKQPHA